MSRAVVMNTIAKLNNLLDEEEGKMIGGGKKGKKASMGGGVMIPYGSGLVSSPAPFGGAFIAGSKSKPKIKNPSNGQMMYVPSNLSSEGRVKRIQQAAQNPWIAFVKQSAAMNNMPYNEILTKHGEYLSQQYHLKKLGNIKVGKGGVRIY